MNQGQTWSTFNPNFDNIVNAMIAVFILSTQEGWPNIMYFAMDGNYAEYVKMTFLSTFCKLFSICLLRVQVMEFQKKLAIILWQL